MNRSFRSQPAVHRQRGAVLIISMVLLLIVTLLGVGGMSNTQLEMRMSGNAAVIGELRQGAESLAALAVDQIEREVALGGDDGSWQRVSRGTRESDLLPPQSPCASAQWRVRRLAQSAGSAASLDSSTYLEAANFELEVECYELGDANSDGELDAADGPSARVTTGVSVRNWQDLVAGASG